MFRIEGGRRALTRLRTVRIAVHGIDPCGSWLTSP
jgi:hypothetical protein